MEIVNSNSPNASTVFSMREKNAGSTEMYNVLKKMKTVLKRVNSTAFEIYFSAYLVKLNIFADIRTVISDSFKQQKCIPLQASIQ